METILGSSLPHIIVALGGAIVAFFKSFKFVQEGELGLKLRFGKVLRTADGKPKVIKPGFAWLIPWVDTLQRRHVRQQEVTLEQQTITLKSGLTFRVAGAVYFRVADIYKALFEITKLDESIEQLSMGVLRDEIAKHENHHDLSDASTIAQKIFDIIKERTDAWGVELIDFRLTTAAPTTESAPIVNLEAAAKIRAKIITESATELGTDTTALVESGLAAVLVGVPLVASANSIAIKQTLSAEAEPE